MKVIRDKNREPGAKTALFIMTKTVHTTTML